VVEALGAEVLEIVDGKIKEIRDYHQRVTAGVAESPSLAAAAQSAREASPGDHVH